MKVAISQRLMQTSSGLEHGEGISRHWREWLGRSKASVTTFPIPSDERSLHDWWRAVQPDAVILSGGEDIGDDPARDDLERSLLNKFAGHVPILGVCRGAQVMNVWAGGRVSASGGGSHVDTLHEVVWQAANWEQLQLVDTVAIVNSFHRQVIQEAELSSSFVPLAVHGDGTVEAFGNTEMRLLGVMWHPERPGNSEQAVDNLLISHLSSGCKHV